MPGCSALPLLLVLLLGLRAGYGAFTSFTVFPPRPLQADFVILSQHGLCMLMSPGPWYCLAHVLSLCCVVFFSLLCPPWEQSLGHLFYALHGTQNQAMCGQLCARGGDGLPGILQMIS